MIPLLWRYMLKSYLKVFTLCLISFIAILLVTRSQDIAKFAALSSEWKMIGLFISYQIPYLLPLAIPISCLISATILAQRLSRSHELTSMRASGISLALIGAPIMIITGFLALANLYIASEIAPQSRIRGKRVLFETAAKNPLILMQKNKLLKIKDSYVDMEMIRSPHLAGNVIFAFRNPSTGRINVIAADELELKQSVFHGKDVAILSTTESKEEAAFDPTILENRKTVEAEAMLVTELLQASSMQLGYEYFPLKQMLIKGKEEGQKAQSVIIFEIYRRLFFFLAPFTLAYIGLVFGTQIGRRSRQNNVFWIVILTGVVFVLYLAAKSFEGKPLLAFLFFFAPHPLVFLLAGRRNWKLAHGVEQ
ncbi:MAG: LptF/LptG family permease [Simkaniaceae bacterium]|nr:LptF/LptG family permease [Simkaniaceae bacterium]